MSMGLEDEERNEENKSIFLREFFKKIRIKFLRALIVKGYLFIQKKGAQTKEQ